MDPAAAVSGEASSSASGPAAHAAGRAASNSGNDQAILVLSATALETAALRSELRSAAAVDRPVWPRALHGELGGVPVVLVESGIGKANAAAAVAAVAARSTGPAPATGTSSRLLAILQLGIGGAYPGSGLVPGDAALASSEFDLDLGVGRHPEWSGLESLGFAALPGASLELNRLALGGELLDELRRACDLRAVPFATSDSVTATPTAAARIAELHGVAIESMEGVAAAQAASLFGLPFVELRGVSNAAGERDKRNWALADAVSAVAAIAPLALRVMWERLTAATKETR